MGQNPSALLGQNSIAEPRDHQETVQLFRTEAGSGQDPALKAFAQKTLPILEQHLQMAQALNKKR